MEGATTSVFLLLFVAVTVLDKTGSRGSITEGPIFDQSMPTHVVSQLHKTVRLNCRVYRLNIYKVSWLKKLSEKDVDVLTVADTQVSSVDRYQIIHRDGSPDWTLQIKQSELEDKGVYECQVSTTPKMSYKVRLNILEAFAVIHGVKQREKGSTLTMKCDIHAIKSPPHIDWKLNNTLLVNDHNVAIGEIVRKKQEKDVTSSKLIIRNISYKYSGIYTCGAPDVEPAKHKVNVVKGSKSSRLLSDKSISDRIDANQPLMTMTTLSLMVMQTTLLS